MCVGVRWSFWGWLCWVTGCLGGGGEYGRWCCEGGFGGALKLSGGVRGGVGRRPLFFEGIAISCRFVYILRRCQYLQGRVWWRCR